MGNVTIEFRGICTQIQLPIPLVDGVLHRTVLVRWDHEGELMPYPPYAGKPVPPHHASLTVIGGIETADVAELEAIGALRRIHPGQWRMDGVRLTVESAVGQVTYEPSYFEIPSLRQLAPLFGELSRDVVYGPDAWCHFDVSNGTFRGVQFDAVNGSWYTFLDVTTSDAPPVLRIELLRDPAIRGHIRLMFGAVISIDNTATPGEDKAHDFLLHYLTAQNPPTDATIPPDAEAMVTGPPVILEFFEIGPGCSNSNFP